jgi:hypothetical protein
LVEIRGTRTGSGSFLCRSQSRPVADRHWFASYRDEYEDYEGFEVIVLCEQADGEIRGVWLKRGLLQMVGSRLMRVGDEVRLNIRRDSEGFFLPVPGGERVRRPSTSRMTAFGRAITSASSRT